MTNFTNFNFNITKIDFACIVPKFSGEPVHKNRRFHGFAFLVNGDTNFIFEDGTKLRVKGNDIIYLPKNSSYAVKKIVPGDCYAVNFDIADECAITPFVLKTKNHSTFLQYFKETNKVWKTKFPGYEMKCKSLVYNIISQMIQELELGYISDNKANIIQPAIDYIHNQYTEKTITIPELAEICHISEIYFRKTFKQVKAISPVKYINRLRLQRAKELLSRNMYTISYVAELSGFNDESYFSREFKKTFGVSPNVYRQTKEINL